MDDTHGDEMIREDAARCGEPSYVWRAGQQRRFGMIELVAGDRIHGVVLENGCGVGLYLKRFAEKAKQAVGLEYEFQRAHTAGENTQISDRVLVVNGAGEELPFPGRTFDLILSHEVLEHVRDDRRAVEEMVRVLKPGGRAVVFVPNRGYPFETHGIYWRGKYHFGNKPLVNYLPSSLRNQLAPHVRVYSSGEVDSLFADLPVKIITKEIIFGAYDNIISRRPSVGIPLRKTLQALEKTPFKVLGLSHFRVVEKV
jgi:SAM-dependent methyltransferase